MNKRNLIINTLLLLLALLPVACGKQEPKFVIGVSQCSEDIWRDKLNNELKTGEYLNDSIIVKLASSNDDNKKQIEQINRFIDDGVDLLIVSPNQLHTISPAIDRAYDKGIPVILYDRKTDSNKYTAFIGCDNYSIGKAMGTFIARRLNGKGKIVEIKGLENSSPAIDRHRGFTDAVAAYPGIEVVASEWGDWKEESAIAAMKKILTKTREFDFVFSHNDRMAWGAYIAAKQMGIESRYRYTGVDAMATEGGGLELVRDGVFDASYLYPTKGDEVIALAMKILKNQPFERDNYLRTSIITKDNAELTLMEAKDSERQKRKLDVLHKQVDRYISEYQAQKFLTIGLVIFLMVIIIATVLVYRGYLVKVRLNEQLGKKNDELEKLNQEVMELTHSRLVFFTNISHELRTPLTLIADPVEMLLDDKSIKGKSRELLTMVKRNAQSLQQLVSSILDFRKIQNGKMGLTLNRFDIIEALTVWVGDFKMTAERKQIKLTLNTADFTHATEIIADKDKIARIVFNLMSNALKYTPTGGSIAVTLQDAPANRLSLSVRNTGKGINKEESEMVFERFFQSKGAASGTGIGLALVKSFTELHHGTARVESEPGREANFIIEIPVEQKGEITIADNIETRQYIDDVEQYMDDGNRHRGKVQQVVNEHTNKPVLLIIDDNNDIRQYERTLLQDEYIVLEAANGLDGLETARKEVPDLVVCDVMMPVMDGLEFIGRLKTDTVTSHIPVIMLTAKNLDEQRITGYEHGADSYITKPFHSKVLLARIENLLKQRALLKNVYKGNVVAGQEMTETQPDDRDKQFIKQLHDIIQQNMGNSNFSVEDIGRQIGLSRVQLYRKVKAMTGSSAVDLIRKARLAKARRLLESRSMSISEAAYETGFSSPSYFTKCFKEEYGIVPGEIGNKQQA